MRPQKNYSLVLALLTLVMLGACFDDRNVHEEVVLTGSTLSSPVQDDASSNIFAGDLSSHSSETNITDTKPDENGNISPDNDERLNDSILAIYSDVIVGPISYKNYVFPMIASMPDKDIYLYGKNDGSLGCILFVGGTSYHYEIPWFTPRFFLPEMRLYDIDKDGIEELVIANYYGSGTGISIWGLCIVKINENDDNETPWPMFEFHPDDYLEQINNAIKTSVLDKQNSVFEMEVGNKKHILDFQDSLLYYENDCITDVFCSGLIVRFNLADHGIFAEFAISAQHELWATPDFFGTIYADCTYVNGVFTLSNFTYRSYHDQGIDKVRCAVENQKELFFPREYYPDDFSEYEIVSVEQHPTRPELFILQMKDIFSWFDGVYLIRCEDNFIFESIEISSECVSKARFVPVGSFIDFFIEFYESTHMGNGGMTLYSINPEVPSFHFYGVYDCNAENLEYTNLQRIFSSERFSYIYKNSFLDVAYSLPYNDEKCTVTFRGWQLLLDENDNILNESECAITFIYDSESKTMVLSRDDCVFPEYWFYNWNAIGFETWEVIQSIVANDYDR